MPNRSRSGADRRPTRVVAPDQGEALQPEPVAARVHAFVEHEIDREVLHGRVEQLLHRFGEPVDLVDEQDVAGFQMGQDPDEIPALFEGRA